MAEVSPLPGARVGVEVERRCEVRVWLLRLLGDDRKAAWVSMDGTYTGRLADVLLFSSRREAEECATSDEYPVEAELRVVGKLRKR
jgi:hypothetical protein